MKDMNVQTNYKNKTIALATGLLLVCGTAGRNMTAQTTNPGGPSDVSAAAPNPAPSVVGSFTHTTTSDQSLHVIVGRSMFVNTAARLRKVYVANSAVLDSYTASPNQIIVTAKTPGISTIILWDENGQSKSYLVSSDVNVEGLQAELDRTIPNEPVKAEGSEGRVVLTGTVSTPAIMASAVKQAELYSKDVANSIVVNEALIKQVRLKVSIVEVDRSKIAQFGFNFFSQGNTSLISSTTTSQFPSSATVTPATASTGAGSTTSVSISNPLNFSLFSTKLNVGMTLQDLENRQVLQILAEPTITTLSGEKANFLAGGEFPFPVVQGGAGGLNSVSVQFRPYGVKLEFTPYVNADGTIELKVAPEVSALDYANAAVISGYTIPALSTRRADTQVVLRSGQSFAITGLLDRRTTDLYGKTPGFSSIPILGELFKSKNVNHAVNELVVIVTPTVVDPLTENLAPSVPAVAIPTLEEKKFDNSLPKAATKNP
jgi:pilus assembly protein CpaC